LRGQIAQTGRAALAAEVKLGIGLFVLPLLLAGGLALGVGALLAEGSGFPVRTEVFGMALAGLAALMVAALCGREAYAPGVGRWPALRNATPAFWRYLAYGCLSAAALLGLMLQFVWHTGDFTLPLGAMGVLVGYFSFAPPLAWYQRPGGEILPALGLGLLPVAAGYYLQGGHLISEILLYGLPLTFSAFNLFLLQGLPDPGRPSSLSPAGLGSRLRPVAMGLIYTLVNILLILALVFCIFFPPHNLGMRPWLWLLILVALVSQELIKRRAYLNEDRIILLIYLNTGLHLGMNLVFILGLWGRL